MSEIELDRRSVLRVGVAASVGSLLGGFVVAGCGPSGGGKTIVLSNGSSSPTGSNPPPSGSTTTTVAAALSSRYGGYSTRPTADGNKIIAVGNVSGESIVYTVNGQRDDSTSPGSKTVRTGDTVQVFDLVNGSNLSFTVS